MCGCKAHHDRAVLCSCDCREHDQRAKTAEAASRFNRRLIDSVPADTREPWPSVDEEEAELERAKARKAARPAEPTGDPFDQANRLARAIVMEWENGGGDGVLQSNIVSVLAPLLAKLRAVEALAEEWEAARDHYAAPIVEAARELRAALGPLAGQHTTDEEGR